MRSFAKILLSLLLLGAEGGYLSAYVPCGSDEDCMSGACVSMDSTSAEGEDQYWCAEPTSAPTPMPTFEPTAVPSAEPTVEPTSEPTTKPTNGPTFKPSHRPTDAPTKPTMSPTKAPTTDPTFEPTMQLVFGVQHLDDESVGYQEPMLPAIQAGKFFHTPSPTPDPFSVVSVSSATEMIDLNATVSVYAADEEKPSQKSAPPMAKIGLGVAAVGAIAFIAHSLRRNQAASTATPGAKTPANGASATSSDLDVITPNTEMHIL